MMNEKEFELWCVTLNLCSEGRELVEKIRTSEPARLVRGGVGNIRGRYPSRTMGKSIQFESESCELYGILTFEFGGADHFLGTVREFYDQPLSFKYKFKLPSERTVTITHVPDFFVLLDSGGAFVEFKPEKKLRELSKKYPGRYVLKKDGRWRCPPAEAYVEQFGLSYIVISDAELSAIFVRNINFIQDYLGEDTPPVSAESRVAALGIVKAEEGISLQHLIGRSEAIGLSADEVNILIANGDLYVDLYAEVLAISYNVHVYSQREAAPTKPRADLNGLIPKARYLNMTEGTRFICDNRVLEIRLLGETKIFFDSDRGPIELLHTRFEELIRRGAIQPVESDLEFDVPEEDRALEILDNALESERAEALRRKRILDCYLNGEQLPEVASPRSLSRWKAAQLTGERVYGNRLVGLLPRFSDRGDRKTQKIHPKALEIALRLLDCEFETYVQKSLFAVYGLILLECESVSVKCPTYVTVNHLKDGLPKYQQARKRKGRRAAYAKKPFYLRLEVNTPRHGDRPFEICHIDHTELDIELVDPVTGENYGRPWATFLVDAFSRRILAVYLTFEEPSYRSCMMVLRECVRRFSRLPQTIVVDGGSEFHSQYFETLMAAFEITIKTRPASQPRFGGVIERLFNTVNEQLIHNLKGNTQITRNVRQVTKDNSPQGLALWSLGWLYEALCDWAYNRYDVERHWTLKRSPRDVFSATLRLTGERKHRLIRYDDHFMKLTLPSTSKGTAKYEAGKGFKCHGEYYRYVGDEVNEEDLDGKQLRVRYEPFSLKYGYVYFNKRWLNCVTDKHPELEGRTEKEQKIISAEIKQMNKLISRELPERAKKRAIDLMSAEAMQEEQSRKLELERKKSKENRTVLARIAGGIAMPGAELPANSNWRQDLGGEMENVVALPSSPFSSLDLTKLERLEELR
jgi:putative transposase